MVCNGQAQAEARQLRSAAGSNLRTLRLALRGRCSNTEQTAPLHRPGATSDVGQAVAVKESGSGPSRTTKLSNLPLSFER